VKKEDRQNIKRLANIIVDIENRNARWTRLYDVLKFDDAQLTVTSSFGGKGEILHVSNVFRIGLRKLIAEELKELEKEMEEVH